MTELTNEQRTVAGRKDVLVNDILTIASDASELVKEKLCETEQKLGEVRTVLTNKARHAADYSGEYVKAHPWRTLGMAAIVGGIVGFLVNRH